jgi:prepilin-type N-terminal cleavage/methylation domain-containing protein
VSNLLKKEKGFTLIEIVLVLAIAGLLLVIVFLAVSGAQKSRRDTQRKNDLSRIASQLESYASNNNGTYPTGAQFTNTGTTGGAFWGAYVTTGNFNDPSSGSAYTTGATSGTTTAPTPGAIGQVTYGIAGRTYQVCIGLEQGVSSCRDNK